MERSRAAVNLLQGLSCEEPVFAGLHFVEAVCDAKTKHSSVTQSGWSSLIRSGAGFEVIITHLLYEIFRNFNIPGSLLELRKIIFSNT